MNRRVFEESVSDLSKHILNTMEVFMRERGLPFNIEDFRDQTSIDVPLMAREAHFFGSDTYPVD